MQGLGPRSLVSADSLVSGPPPDLTPPQTPFVAPIILVGMMGAGKTTIGRALARAMNREFVDVDLVIEARTGVKIPTIFEVEGETGFRRRETATIDEFTRRSGVVLATGGGAVVAPQNQRLLAERGIIIYLRARAEELYARTRYDKNRPLLQTADPLGRITELLEARQPLYERLADVVVDTGRHPIPRLVQRLIPQLQACVKPVADPSTLPPLEKL